MKDSKVFNYSFGCDLIEEIADVLYKDFYKNNRSLERVACVFGGKRPGLFLKDRLWRKIKKSFIPPVIFSMDQFMHYIVSKQSPVTKMPDLELYHFIYQVSRKKLKFLNSKQLNFSKFLSWAKEIAAFIEQLDLEGIKDVSLLDVQKSAAIGYEIPESMNYLLKNIVSVRKDYHKYLRKNKLYSRGMIYLEAANRANKEKLKEFDQIFFCDLFYLHKTEKEVVNKFYKTGKTSCVFQGSNKRWPILDKNFKLLAEPVKFSKKTQSHCRLKFYQGFDSQSQVGLAKKILKSIKNKDETLILLPNPETLIPLLSEASCQLDEFNVSLGYPLAKTSLAALFSYLFDVHHQPKAGSYYAKDYLKVLRHPLIKNISIKEASLTTRILVHKIEEALTGTIKSSIGGSLFISLSSIENDQDIYNEYKKTLNSLGYGLNKSDYYKTIKQIHNLFFRNWEKVDSFGKFSKQLKTTLDCLSTHQLLAKFPLELKSLDALYKIEENFSSLSFAVEAFGAEQIWNIFKQSVEATQISFIGSPLRGAQILGLFETRALQFKNVIVLDANEGILPKLKITEPLVPAEVKMSLGLPALGKEEEIQRYHFMRLVESAENVFLIWAKNQALEKSRFIEKIIWNRQKKENKIDLDSIPQASFLLSFPKPAKPVKKNSQIIKFLKNSTYSASRINTYLNCPLQFYYKYVLGLAEKENLLEGVKDSQIGNFIHQFLFEAYSKFLGKKPVFDQKFNKYFQENFNRKYEKELKPRMQSDSFLLKEIIKARIDKFFQEERERAVDIVRIEALEQECFDQLELGKLTLDFRYTVDRIDLFKGNRLCVIDYKTGGSDVIPAKLNNLEKMDYCRKEIKNKIKSFQLPLYYYFTQKNFKEKEVNAYIYNLRTAERKPFISYRDYQKKDKVLDYCLNALKFIFNQMFDPNIDFEADKDSRRCNYCPFYSLCS
ncbi:MAG: PD-(D/E)XK nuclease family protein [Candidatus Omnitrophica bacterium]|nr:PD-(D/E)XK nuclease family protein [Candidatus Omnitrophota bacterium]MCF7877643.1 PD-(D/E)XK nuclease family protein [Candidatus Omnitrophota bacterium]MCF7891528.1 PD-(D/E)XK nuclease family protein [Candidatus Omnitrophota bacterium]MCF7895861.1 PD-(D/E)XK nuclease family protein [Candidatus Omnitrophota bacterium]MCF7897360.1 PD-(D/E)XK nuclease family protein [Candidatus Omnitrophota bacterium]